MALVTRRGAPAHLLGPTQAQCDALKFSIDEDGGTWRFRDNHDAAASTDANAVQIA